jgi:hypothetical protein
MKTPPGLSTRRASENDAPLVLIDKWLYGSLAQNIGVDRVQEMRGIAVYANCCASR